MVTVINKALILACLILASMTLTSYLILEGVPSFVIFIANIVAGAVLGTIHGIFAPLDGDKHDS